MMTIMQLYWTLLVIILTGYCHGETCRTQQDCSHTSCNHGHIECNNNYCICHSASSSYQLSLGTSTSHGETCHYEHDCVVTSCNVHLNYSVKCVNGICECDSNTCASELCNNHGTCYNHGTYHTCQCQHGYHGNYCQFSPCTTRRCAHGGTCLVSNTSPYYTCSCPPGFHGYVCAQYNHCLVSPCEAGYTCTSTGLHSRKCECTSTACQNAHVCDSKPCHHSGTCEKMNSSPYYKCTCHHGFSGQNCTETACDNNPCGIHGHCSRTSTQPNYKCRCSTGYSGQHCQYEICTAGNCLNGGTCIPNQHTGNYTCSCLREYTGTNCQVKVVQSVPSTTVRTTKHVSATTSPALTMSVTTTSPKYHITDVIPDENHGPYCLTCDDVASPNTCEYITRCGPHEICYVDSVVTSLGSMRYNLGCRDKRQCANKKRSVARRMSNTQADASTILICSECCQDHVCNSGGCGVKGYTHMTTQERGPVCFNCDQSKSPSECSNIAVCGRDEACMVTHTSVATTHEVLWKSACMHVSECVQDIHGFQNNSHVDAFVSPDVKYGGMVSGGQCAFMCCLHDLCNRHCPDFALTLIG